MQRGWNESGPKSREVEFTNNAAKHKVGAAGETREGTPWLGVKS